MLLHSLLRQVDSGISLGGIPDIEIQGISEDSRLVRTGDLFVARAGTKTDGAKYIADAHQRGAVAVVTQQSYENFPLPQIVIADSAAASYLAHLFHHRPSNTLRVLGVTGTNGKTTTTYLIRHLLAKLNQRCGLIGTIQIDDGRSTRESSLTTPGPVEVAALMASMRDKGCRACAMEVSSHALHQRRTSGVEFAGAGFTNLSGDHLDYHGTMESYADSKAALFAQLHPDAVAVVNGDDPASRRMIRDCKGRVITFGMSKDADYRARDIAVNSEGSSFVLSSPDGRADVHMSLIGRHNIENALCAAALLGETCGLTVHQIAAGLQDASGAPGRLQSVRAGQPFAVLVDYAHTDDALQNVLTALRPITRGTLRVVFGCGGDRDRTKRPRMARVAAEIADVVYVTSDNPRTEQPQAIVDEILTGIAKDCRKTVNADVDRRAAIERALHDSGENDVVLIAGKGHENYQVIGTTKHHFDDMEEATRILTSKQVA